MPKNQVFWDKIKAARAHLDAKHPGLFSLENPQPLSLNIRVELLLAYPEIPRTMVNKLLWWLTLRRPYLQACVAGTPRAGLAGPDGEVTQAQAHYAVAMFKRRERAAKRKVLQEV